jgi:hypothetical protein
MNFLRNALLNTLLVPPSESRDALPEVEDPEMDAAINEMKDRLAALRAQGDDEREKFHRQQEQLQQNYGKVSTKYLDRVSTFVKTARLAEYLAATKEVRDYIVPGVVASLQAQLCLHVHGICLHNEATCQSRADASSVIFWFEDMVKQLRQDQAEQELKLINMLVQAKIELGDLVDAKKLREKREERHYGDMPRKTLSRKFSRTVSHSTSSIIMPRKTPSRKFSRQVSRHQKGGPVVQPTINAGNRQRVIRAISRRGNAHRPSIRVDSQGSTSQNFQEPEMGDGSWNTLGSGRRRSSGNFSIPPSLKQAETTTSATTCDSSRELNVSGAILEEEDPDSNNKSSPPPPFSSTEESSPGLEDPSDDIAARRAARAKARENAIRRGREVSPRPTETNSSSVSDRSRPIVRGVQRTRSRSLTSNDERRAARKPIPRHASKDDSGVLNKSTSSQRKSTHQLLRGFSPQPPPLVASSQRKSTHQLLRGFSPQPPPLVASSPQSSDSSIPKFEEGTFTSTFRNWMGKGKPAQQPSNNVTTNTSSGGLRPPVHLQKNCGAWVG